MSRMKVEMITCPECSKESEFVVWDSINTMLDPDMKEKVITKEAFKFRCPQCGHEAIVDYGLLYHQMEDKMMIYYVQNDEAYEKAYGLFSGKDMPEMMAGMMEDKYLYRIVTSLNSLREKIFIFDAGLDDREIEIAKLFYIGMAKDQGIEIEHIFFDVNSDGEYSFAVFDNKKYVGNMELKKDLLNQIRNNYLVDNPPIREDRFDIDFDWAMEMINSKE